jgi:hypothetical protein
MQSVRMTFSVKFPSRPTLSLCPNRNSLSGTLELRSLGILARRITNCREIYRRQHIEETTSAADEITRLIAICQYGTYLNLRRAQGLP